MMLKSLHQHIVGPVDDVEEQEHPREERPTDAVERSGVVEVGGGLGAGARRVGGGSALGEGKKEL